MNLFSMIKMLILFAPHNSKLAVCKDLSRRLKLTTFDKKLDYRCGVL